MGRENKPTILVVDDNFDLLRAYERNFGVSYEVTTANSVEEARKYLDREYDIAWLDGLEGACFGLIPQIKAKRKIIFTGNMILIESERAKKAREEGVEIYDKSDHSLKISDILKGKGGKK